MKEYKSTVKYKDVLVTYTVNCTIEDDCLTFVEHVAHDYGSDDPDMLHTILLDVFDKEDDILDYSHTEILCV